MVIRESRRKGCQYGNHRSLITNHPIKEELLAWISLRRKKITRRQFIKGAAVAVTLPLLAETLPFYGTLAHAAAESDLVIAKNGSPTQLLQAAMTPLGGMGRFVKKGQRVVIKANIAWARTPEQACTNNPELMMALIKMCYEAGAKKVAVWDHTCDNYQFTFARVRVKGSGSEGRRGRPLRTWEKRLQTDGDPKGKETENRRGPPGCA